MANDFSSDPSFKALWRFESGAITTDSIGGNTLVDALSVSADTTNYKEGSCSVYFPQSDHHNYLTIQDANLDAGFPLKNGDTNKVATFVCWFRDGGGHVTYNNAICKSEYLISIGTFEFQVYNNNLQFRWYYSGSSGEVFIVFTPTVNRWYHIGVRIDGVNKDLSIRVYDSVADTVTNYDFTPTNVLQVDNAPLAFGSAYPSQNNWWQGNLDEVAFSDRWLSDSEIDDIRNGNFKLTLPLPTVITLNATDITQNSAIGHGNVLDDGGGTIIERGFVWSISANPTISDDKVTVSGTTGEFSGNLTGLSDEVIYHYRAYATSAESGTAYGEDRSFTTLSISYVEFEEMEERTFSKPIVIVTLGSFEVPQYDIMDLDQLVLSRSDDFSVVTSDITITLNNNTGKYSPGKSNFIWAGESWYHQYFKLEFTYQDIDEKYLLFEGYITKWNQKKTKDAAYDSQIDGDFVEVTAEDHCSMLEDRVIGQPNDDGSANPFVHGHIFRQAEPLDAKTFWSPVATIDYETGDTSQADSVTGSVTVVTTDPYEGIYCAYHTGTGQSYCTKDVGGASGTNEIQVSGYLKITDYADPVGYNTKHFFNIVDKWNQELISLTTTGVNPDHKLTLNYYPIGFFETSILVEDIKDRWIKIDIIAANDVPNNQSIVRVFMDGDEIVTESNVSYANYSFRYVNWGLYALGTESWTVYTDQVKCYNFCYPLGQYLPGGAYQSINAVYVDGNFWPRNNKPVWRPFWNNGEWKFNYMTYVGKSSHPENYRTNLTYCIVDFLDYENQPNGSIIIDATKDTVDHPIDQIEDILTEVDLDDRIDAASFAMAKAINPYDTTGIYIDNQSAADAITAICQNTMNSFVERQGYFGILPFTGEHKTSYVKTLNNSNCNSFEEATDMDNLQTQVDVVWGWYDNNKRLFYRVKNDGMISIVGTQSTKLDLSYGQDVSTNNADMAKAKARLLLNRYSGPIDEVIIKGNLSIIRIEIGDGVLVDSDLNDTSFIYEVINKAIDFNEKTVELKLHRYSSNDYAAAFSGTSTISPLILLSGDATVEPTTATSGAETFIGAIITDVDYAYLPQYITASGSVVNPTFIYGDINFTPTQAEGIGASIDPTVTIS